jgi:short-subunit dehydrogenase
MKHIMEDNIDDLTNGFKTSVGNALEAVKTLLTTLKKSKGSVLFSGGNSATNPNPDMGSISLGKAGIKNLAYQLNKVLATDGIYVGTLTISGWIQPDSQTHSPKILAEKFWDMNSKRADVEIVY